MASVSLFLEIDLKREFRQIVELASKLKEKLVCVFLVRRKKLPHLGERYPRAGGHYADLVWSARSFFPIGESVGIMLFGVLQLGHAV